MKWPTKKYSIQQRISYLVLFILIGETQSNYSPYSYKINHLSPFSFNAEQSLTRAYAQTSLHHAPVQHYHHQRQPQQQQSSYLSLPFLNSYASNLRKKPTTTSSFVFNKNTNHKHHAGSSSHNNNNNNLHIYNKRYKRYPPFQTMPEIPIKKGIGRYLPYAPMYSMSMIGPSILLPLYMTPVKASTRIMLKPTVTELASTVALPTSTELNKTLLLNYLRLANDKQKQAKTQSSTTTTTTTTLPATTTIGNYAVASQIKFYDDTPFSETNLQQQKHYYNNNNYATHFLLPMMPATAATAPYTYTTTTSTTTDQYFKRMPQHVYSRGQIVDDKGDFEFLPTWYPYAKETHKQSNFFTIEDAITPYKPNEPLNTGTIGYQPTFYYENTQTENYAHIKPTGRYNMEFTAMHANTTTTEAAKNESSTTTATVSSFLEELSREASKWNLFDEEKVTTAKTQGTSTVGTLKIAEITLTTAAPITTTTRNMSKLERALKMAENVEPHRVRVTTLAPATTSYSTTVKKVLRKKSFFDDWFNDEQADESSTTTATVVEKATTTPLTDLDSKLHRLKWPTKRRHQNMTRLTTTTTQQTLNLTTVDATSVLKKPRKKYGNAKTHKQNKNLTTEIKTNGTAKLVKRIKKVLRVRPTLFSALKLQNKNVIEQIERPLQTSTTQITQDAAQDNTQNTVSSVIATTTTQAPPTSTTTTTTSTTIKTYVEDDAERTHFGGTQRKRGRLSYYNNNNNNNNNERRSTTAAPGSRSERQERLGAHKKSRPVHIHARKINTTTTRSTTTMEPEHYRNVEHFVEEPAIRNHRESFDSSSTTMESAIMKIGRNKRIKSILDNLLITPSTTTATMNAGITELPQLPIELYFQKIKTAF